MSTFKLHRRAALIGAGAALIAGCAKSAEPVRTMTLYKDPNCGCCTAWLDHMKQAGFKATVIETSDLASVRKKLGVPEELASCHTAQIGRYAVEGHVPPEDVLRLLQEKPNATGLAVPGMPIGSPGMESPTGERERFQTLLFGGGQIGVFAQHG
ncbi:DUF411 domain-containing protein [Caulobacter sp. 17J65-9]|nr:DUF411 domain-containing protein [Caulobacter sp. 17J65-9]